MQWSVALSFRLSCPVSQTIGVARHLDSIDRSLSPSDAGPLEAMEHEAQGEGSRLPTGKDAADPAVVETVKSIAWRMAGHYAAVSAAFQEDQRERGLFPGEDSGLQRGASPERQIRPPRASSAGMPAARVSVTTAAATTNAPGRTSPRESARRR